MDRLHRKIFTLALGLLLTMLLIPASATAAEKKSPAAKPKVSVSQIHVIKGCTACETMQAWLKQGGVKLEIVNVQQGNYALYPTVLYSDRTADHGDRMYKHQVQIPGKVCVVVCEYGIE